MATLTEQAAHRTVIKFCVDLGMTPTETKDKLHMTETHKNVSRALVFKWHKRFSEGYEEKDAIKKGRPREITDEIKEKVRSVINEDRRQTVREVAELVNICKSSVHNILTVDLSMRRVCARWVPRLLTENQKDRRVRASQAFLQQYRKKGDEEFLDRIITTDETWLHYYDPEGKRESSVWKTAGTPPPKKAKVSKSAGKHMFMMFMDRHGMILTHAVPDGQTVNAEYYSKVIRRDLAHALQKKRPELAADKEKIIFHQDNAPSHTAEKTEIEIDIQGFQRIIHPPYSPDLAPMDFALFPYLKTELRGQRFFDLTELKKETLRILGELDQSWFINTFDKWIKRHQKCIDRQGEYFEKE